MIDKIFTNNKGQEFKVLTAPDTAGDCMVQFLATDTTTSASVASIKRKLITDPSLPCTAGVGARGHKPESDLERRYLSRWATMLHRCHNQKDKDFIYYGGKGVTVSDEFKTFSNFWQWVKTQEHPEWELDSDLYSIVTKEEKRYSRESLVFLPKELNFKLVTLKKVLSQIQEFKSGATDKPPKGISIQESKIQINIRRSGFNYSNSFSVDKLDSVLEILKQKNITDFIESAAQYPLCQKAKDLIECLKNS